MKAHQSATALTAVSNSPPESVVFRGHLMVLVLLLLEVLEPLLLGHQLLLLHLYLVLLPRRHPTELLNARALTRARAHFILGAGPIMHF